MFKMYYSYPIYYPYNCRIQNINPKRYFEKPFKVLNGLERMGYRVVTSSSMITGYGKHDTRDFIWTLHKVKIETLFWIISGNFV